MRIDMQASELIRKKVWSSMPTPLGPHNEHASTYFVRNKNEKKLARLTVQDQMITAAMGGVLPEQPDPTIFRRVLDVGCGPGGWLIEVARTYPTMLLVGVDASPRMISYARAQAQADPVNDRIEFHVMDALGRLDFPAASFDLVNLRLGISFLRTWDWPKLLSEMLRVTCPGGVIRLTEGEMGSQSNSPALTRLCEVLQCAFFQASHLFEQERSGLTSHLVPLLSRCGCQQVQTKTYAIAYRMGTAEGEAYYEDMRLAFQTARPFIQKHSCEGPDYVTTYRRALKEMCHPDFCATWNILSVWGSKPELD